MFNWNCLDLIIHVTIDNQMQASQQSTCIAQHVSNTSQFCCFPLLTTLFMFISLHKILDGLGGQAPEMEAMFWVIGATIFAGFAGLWVLFFVSIHKSEDEQDDDEEGRMVGLTSRFVQQQEVYNAQGTFQIFFCTL